MNSWAEAPLLEVVKDFSVHTDVFGSGSVFHWADNDAIGVINVTHNDVIVAPAGNGRETSSEISSKESSGFNNTQVDCFCSCGRWEGCIIVHKMWQNFWLGQYRAGGSDILAGKFRMPLCSC